MFRLRSSMLAVAGLASLLSLQTIAHAENHATGMDEHHMHHESAVPDVTPIVETAYGKVQGLKDHGINEYLGVRYGKAPTGELRFMPPVAPDHWDGIADATSLGAPAMQMYDPSGPRTSDFTRQIQTIFPTGAESKIDNEDSLFLNVWTPGVDDKKRPVMVWFHGGGYAYGSGGWAAYDGRNLAEKGDVVVVTVNHRLNVFGYLYLGDKFGEDFAKSGNVGNLDLVASLEWVRDNIEKFGGDPSNVTIMGESGGGSKVSHLLATPSAKGLFHKAVIQSGPGVTSGSKAKASELANAFLKEANIETLDQLRAMPAEDILSHARKAYDAIGGRASGASFGPIVDGVVLPRDPFIPAGPEQSKDVPIMIGWNKDEMTIFTAAQDWFGTVNEETLPAMVATLGEDGQALVDHYRQARPDDQLTYAVNSAMTARFVYGTYVLADQKFRQGGAPVYMYRLTWETPVNGGIMRAPHTLDIPFMFNNVDESRVLVGPGKEPEKLGAMMSDAWISFARSGTPSSELMPEWTPYDTTTRSVMEFDLEPHMTDDPEKAIRQILTASAMKKMAAGKN